MSVQSAKGLVRISATVPAFWPSHPTQVTTMELTVVYRDRNS